MKCLAFRLPMIENTQGASYSDQANVRAPLHTVELMVILWALATSESSFSWSDSVPASFISFTRNFDRWYVNILGCSPLFHSFFLPLWDYDINLFNSRSETFLVSFSLFALGSVQYLQSPTYSQRHCRIGRITMDSFNLSEVLKLWPNQVFGTVCVRYPR